MTSLDEILDELRVALISHRRVFLENAAARVYRRDTELPPLPVGVEHPCAGHDEYWVPFTDTIEEWNQRIRGAKSEATEYQEAGKTILEHIMREANRPFWTHESFADELLRIYQYDGMEWQASSACFEDLHEEDQGREVIQTHWFIPDSARASDIEREAIKGGAALQRAIDALTGAGQADLSSEVEEVSRAALRDGQPRWFPREVRWTYLKDLDDAIGRATDWVVRVSAGPDSHHRPDDLITTVVALQRFNVKRRTIQRALKRGELKSYRDEGAPKNRTHLFSAAELARFYPKH